jgi:hypothetical protein
MVIPIREWILRFSLSNPKNWYLHSEQGWSLEMDGMSKPRYCYKHKKHPYIITNVFMKAPLPFNELIDKFMIDYKNDNLLLGECLYVLSD